MSALAACGGTTTVTSSSGNITASVSASLGGSPSAKPATSAAAPAGAATSAKPAASAKPS